ncbi:MFS transporter [Parachryseolinea silvisoli]|uniref:MFS transporter n=1 Tax=Parachryseolinea silvisoli TaxID=2873601 RepID=UPI002265F4B5|nr:MFS transporter [Parachryseolinea silvisoli]MCD9019909.1 MFS transporter [Parachryseolinea silvisoli]
MNTLKQILRPPVIIAALGYFVDIYDLLLFSIVRVPSLRALGRTGDALLRDGIFLINIQMAGLLTGGILWGILGDKRGRLSVLFGSILLYSLANLANGFVTTVPQYAILRFIAGVGLAGELGAGITLVAEILPRQIRGYGTTLVAAVGLFGAVLAYFVAELTDWQVAYWIGGGLGLCLLLLRYSVSESGMFAEVRDKKVERGNFFILFSRGPLLASYLRCILIGLPIWFVIGILVTFSPEFAVSMNLPEAIDAGKAVMCCYIGLSLGDLSSGLLSQALKSRKKVVLVFLFLTATAMAIYLTSTALSATAFYTRCFFLGFAIGYWALFVTIAAEQFGTNIRATVATTVPNFVRGTVVPLTLAFEWLRISHSMIFSAWVVGGASLLIAALALWKMKETFGKDLHFVE